MYAHRSLLLLLGTCAVFDTVTGQCTLNYRSDFDTKLAQPVFLTNGKYLVPDAKSCNAVVPSGQDIIAACPGTNNYVVVAGSNKKPKLEELVAKCISGTKFKTSQGDVTLRQLSCANQPDVTIKKLNNACGDQSKSKAFKYQIGYEVQGKFHPSYEVCFDDQLMTTYYAKHVVHPHSCLTQSDVKQSFQRNGMFEGVPIIDLYTKKYQKKRFEEIFGPNQNYVKTTGNKHCFEKGHLESRADATMAAEIRATYQYVNAAPQWREVNAPRWSNLESALRKYLNQKLLTATVYTGTHGILSLPKPNSADQSVYLYRDLNNKVSVPAPLYFYKVVDDSITPTKVYVTINWNNFDNVKITSLRFCNDACKLDWKNMGPYSFCCDYARFVQHVGYSPI